MSWSMRNINCINTLCALLLSSQPTAGTVFVPRDVASDETIARRACEPAAPDVSQSSIIAGVCNQTLANGFPTCSDQMTVQMQQSAANTCGQYSSLLTDCLIANKNDHTACSDSLFGYQDCQVYTMQAYAYCACYYTFPASIADCANEQLQPQPRSNATVPTTSTLLTAVPTSSDIPASAVPANKEPTPPIFAASQEATSASPLTFSSDPRISSAPIWSLNAAPSTTTTVISTYATIFTDTTNATITSTVVSTVYTCSDDDTTVSTLSTPIAPAPEIYAPHPAILPSAQSTATGIPAEETEISSPSPFTPPPSSPSETSQAQNTAIQIAQGQITSLETSTSTSASAPILAPTPALVTAIIPSVVPAAAGRNGSAVCAVCRRGRRSKVF